MVPKEVPVVPGSPYCQWRRTVNNKQIVSLAAGGASHSLRITEQVEGNQADTEMTR